MAEKKPAPRTAFKPGESGNKNGSPAKVRIIKSPLRKTAASLREIEEDCLAIIKKAVLGKEVDKVALDTARWTIAMIQTLDKSASAEEIASAKVRLDAKKAEDSGAGIDDVHNADVVPMARLKLTYDADQDED